MVDLGQESKRLTSKVTSLPNSKLKSSAESMAVMVEGISAMAASMEKVVEHTKHLNKQTEEAEKTSKGLLRNFSNLSKQSEDNPLSKGFGKQWMVLRRLSSGTPLWAIQNALVGVMNQTELLLDFFGGKGTGTKIFTKLGGAFKKTGGKLAGMFSEEKSVSRIREMERSIGIGKIVQQQDNIVGGKRLKTSDLRQLPPEFLSRLESYKEMGLAEDEDLLKMVHEYIATELANQPKKTNKEKLQEQREKLKEKWGKFSDKVGKKLKKFNDWRSKFNFRAAGRVFLRVMGILIKFAVAFFLLVFIFKALKLDKVLKGIWDTIVIMVKAIIYGVGKVIEGVGNIIGGIIDVYNSIESIIEEGNFAPLFEALWRIGKGVLQILFGIVWTVVGPILEYYVGFFKYILFGWLTSFYTDSMETGQKLLSTLTLIATMIGVIYTFIAMPFGLAAILVAAVVAAIGLFAQHLIRGGMATGGVASGGLTLVGERGPELVNLPSGSRVYNNNESRQLATGMTNNITVNVKGRICASDAELREIAQKVGRMINLELNRTTSTRTRGA